VSAARLSESGARAGLAGDGAPGRAQEPWLAARPASCAERHEGLSGSASAAVSSADNKPGLHLTSWPKVWRRTPRAVSGAGSEAVEAPAPDPRVSRSVDSISERGCGSSAGRHQRPPCRNHCRRVDGSTVRRRREANSLRVATDNVVALVYISGFAPTKARTSATSSPTSPRPESSRTSFNTTCPEAEPSSRSPPTLPRIVLRRHPRRRRSVLRDQPAPARRRRAHRGSADPGLAEPPCVGSAPDRRQVHRPQRPPLRLRPHGRHRDRDRKGR
jgi:hypothetical protein